PHRLQLISPAAGDHGSIERPCRGASYEADRQPALGESRGDSGLVGALGSAAREHEGHRRVLGKARAGARGGSRRRHQQGGDGRRTSDPTTSLHGLSPISSRCPFGDLGILMPRAWLTLTNDPARRKATGATITVAMI